MRKPTPTLHELTLFALEAAPAAMFVVDQSGRIEWVNAKCEEVFGFTRAEMEGMSVETLIPAGMRAKHLYLREDFKAHPSSRRMGADRETRALRRDGSEFPVEIGLTPIATPLGMCAIAYAIDITARVERENSLKNTAAELERSNASLSRLAYASTHDVQEPLRKIIAFADIFRTAMAQNDAEEARYAANVMLSSAQRAGAIVADVLAREGQPQRPDAETDHGRSADSDIDRPSRPHKHAGRAALEQRFRSILSGADRKPPPSGDRQS